MKYIRKVMVMLIVVIIFASTVIGLGIIFSVKNVNVTLLTYSSDYEEGYTTSKEKLSSLKGESLLLVDEEKITKALDGNSYSLASYEKVYPCTINVTLKERIETFAVSVGGKYSMYDSDGKFLRQSQTNENIHDLSPNVLVYGAAVEQLKEVASVVSIFKGVFNSLRSTVESVTLDYKSDVTTAYIDKVIFKMRCGVQIVIADYANLTQEKIEASYSKFSSLSDGDKLGGTLIGYELDNSDGAVYAEYTPL
jgi:cell division septal protein FtsQ